MDTRFRFLTRPLFINDNRNFSVIVVSLLFFANNSTPALIWIIAISWHQLFGSIRTGSALSGNLCHTIRSGTGLFASPFTQNLSATSTDFIVTALVAAAQVLSSLTSQAERAPMPSSDQTENKFAISYNSFCRSDRSKKSHSFIPVELPKEETGDIYQKS